MGQAQMRRLNDAGGVSRSRAGSNVRVYSQNRVGESARRRDIERIRDQDVELWEINKQEDQPRLMRLADQEANSTRSRRSAEAGRRPAGPQPIAIAGRGPARVRSVQAVRRRRAKRRKVLLYRLFAMLVIAVCLVLIYQTTGAIYRMTHKEKTEKSRGIVDIVSEKIEKRQIVAPEIMEDFLEINDYSRPGTKLKKVKSVFVHYTANPGTSARQNRSYFANLAETHERSASAHFIIGYEGELVQCIPLEEQAYAVATRNEDSVSIECCYLDEDGKFTQETYDTLVHTLAWLVQEYDLSTEDILRHYDCGGKKCPLYYVEHEDAWGKLLSDVEGYKPERSVESEKSNL